MHGEQCDWQRGNTVATPVGTVQVLRVSVKQNVLCLKTSPDCI
jgi:hypothetical protein